MASVGGGGGLCGHTVTTGHTYYMIQPPHAEARHQNHGVRTRSQDGRGGIV